MKILEFILNLGNRPSVILYEISCLLCMMVYLYGVHSKWDGMILFILIPFMWICQIGFSLGLIIEKSLPNYRLKLNRFFKIIHMVLFVNGLIVTSYALFITFGILVIMLKNYL